MLLTIYCIWQIENELSIVGWVATLQIQITCTKLESVPTYQTGLDRNQLRLFKGEVNFLITIESSFDDIEILVQKALDGLRINESLLFNNHSNERSITHRLAVRLEPFFEGWDIDCEYSRIGEDLGQYKRVLLEDDNGDIPWYDMSGSRVFPDIVIHHRGCNDSSDNLLVIEVKTTWSQDRSDRDLKKLAAFTGHLKNFQIVQYRFGLFLKLNDEGVVVEEKIFSNEAT